MKCAPSIHGKYKLKKGVAGWAKEKSSDNFRIEGKGGTRDGSKKEDIKHVPLHPSTQRLCSKLKRGMSFGLDQANVEFHYVPHRCMM